MARLITVFGATGAQGSPIVHSLLAGGFKVRAVTRNPDSEKAKALNAAGAEVVKGDLENIPSVEAAVKGAYGVFYVTNFWELFGRNQETAYDKEIEQGKAVANVCKQAGVKHVVYSALDAVKEKIGTLCPHYDSKAVVDKYLDEIGVPKTSVRYPFYFDNFITLSPKKQDDGSYVHTSCMDGPMDAISVADGGPIVAAVFSKPEEFIGKVVSISGDKLTLHEYMAIIGKVTGKTIRYQQVAVEVYAKFPFPGADDLAIMFDFFARGPPTYDLAITRKINSKTLRFEEWAEKNKEKLAASLV